MILELSYEECLELKNTLDFLLENTDVVSDELISITNKLTEKIKSTELAY